MPDEWFNSTCWSSLLSGIFMINKCVMISLTSFASLKYDYDIKTIEMFNLLPLINNALTIGFSFLLLIISAIISSKQLIFYVFFPKLYSAIFL